MDLGLKQQNDNQINDHSTINRQSENDLKKKSKGRLVFVAIALLLVAIIVLLVSFLSNSTKRRAAHQIDLGNRYLSELEYEQAMAAFEEALRIDPVNEEARDGLVKAGMTWADMLALQNEYEQTIDIYNRVLLYDPENTSALDGRVDAYKQWTEALIEAGETDEAIRILRDAYEQTDDDNIGLLFGNALLEGQYYDEAQVIYEGLIEKDEKNADAWLGMVELFIRQGDFDKALQYARDGFKITGDQRLNEKIQMIESGNIIDSRGRISKEIVVDGNGNILCSFTNTYRVDGNIDTRTHYDSSGNKGDTVIYEYDDKGRNIVNYTFNQNRGNFYMKVITTYESDNRRRQDSYDYMDGTHRGYTIEEYDIDGKIHLREYYDADDEMQQYDTFEYNDERQLVKSNRFSSDATLTGYSILIYNENGYNIGQIEYDANGKEFDRIYYFTEYEGQ